MKVSKIKLAIIASFIGIGALGAQSAIARPKPVRTKPVVKVQEAPKPKIELATPPATPVAPVAETAPIIDFAGLKASNDKALLEAKGLKEAGNMAGAVKIWQGVFENSASDNDGLKQSIEAAKNLGYYYLENQDLRRAEAYFAAESILSRRLYFMGGINAKPFTDAIKHWASAAGLMMRSNESAALVFYAREVGARERAALSSQVLNREAAFAADKIEGVKVNAGVFCATSYVPALAKKVSCEEEISTKTEALSLQARQIKADAPKPMSKEEREAKSKEKGEE